MLFSQPNNVPLQDTSCKFFIEGSVYDRNTEQPLPFVKISIEGTNIGSLTDENGYFKINQLCEKEHDIIFTSAGYKAGKHHHDFHHSSLKMYLAPNEYTLNNVLVEAKRNVPELETIISSTLDAEDLKKVSTESLAAVLTQISGVSMLSVGQNVAKPMIHGLHSNRVLIINNGVRHEFQNWGEDHAPEIDPSLIDKIEVIKGAGTVRYGPEAMGGVIVIHPPKMELNTDLEGNLQLIGKTNGRSGEGILELRKGFKWFSLIGGGSYIKQGDLHAPDYLLTNTGKEEYSYYGGFNIHPIAELDLEGYYSRFNQELGILRGSVFGNLDDLELALSSDVPLFTDEFSYDIAPPRQMIEHDLYKLKATYTGRNHMLSAQYGYQKNSRQEFGVRRVNAPNIDLELITESAELAWRHPELGSISGKLGFQWQKQANDNLPGTNTVPFIPNFDSEEFGGYFIESIKLGSNVLELGARFDHFNALIIGREPDNTIYQNRIVYNNVSGTLGYKHKLGEALTFQTNIGTAWRPPNVAELYRFGQHSFFLEYGLWRYTINDQFDFISTSQGILDETDRPVPSEIAYKWVNTFLYQRENFQLEATSYVNFISNYIYSRPGGLTRTPRGFFVFFLYDQADALFWGIDITAEKEHSNRLVSTVKASYLNARQLNPSDRFAGLPPARINYTLNYHPNIPGKIDVNLGVDLSYTFEQYQHPRIIPISEFLMPTEEIDLFSGEANDFDILPPPSSFFLTHILANVSWQQLSWQFQVRNLFNTSYRNYTDRIRYFADDIGRNISISIEYQF